MTNTTKFDPDAMRLCRKRVEEFYLNMEEDFDRLVDELFVIADPPHMGFMYDVCEAIGLNPELDGNELTIVAVPGIAVLKSEPGETAQKPSERVLH